MPNMKRWSSISVKAVAPFVAGVVLVILMIADTTFLSAEESVAANDPVFTASGYVEANFSEISSLIDRNAIELTIVAGAVSRNPDAAGEEYGISLGAGRYVYQVVVTGLAETVDEDFIYLTVDDMPNGAVVRVPLGPALSGTPVRDATGTIQFGDFVDQNDYQSVANEFKLKILSDVLGPADPPSLAGKRIKVVGAVVAGLPANTYFVQPISIEVAE